MSPLPNCLSAAANAPEPLPLSLLNDLLYCPRRAALKVVEGWRAANAHTARGDILHEHADLPGYEVAKGVTVLRALPVWSDRLGLSGKCDVVEAGERKAESRKQKAENRTADYRTTGPYQKQSRNRSGDEPRNTRNRTEIKTRTNQRQSDPSGPGARRGWRVTGGKNQGDHLRRL